MNFQIGKIQSPPKSLAVIPTPKPEGEYNKKLIAEGNKPTVKKASFPKKSSLFDNLKKEAISPKKTAKMFLTGGLQRHPAFNKKVNKTKLGNLENQQKRVYDLVKGKGKKFQKSFEGALQKNTQNWIGDFMSKKASFMGKFIGATAKKSIMPMAVTGGVGYMQAKQTGSKTPVGDATGMAMKNITLPFGHEGLNVGEAHETVFKRNEERKKNLHKSLFSNISGIHKNEIPGT